MSVRISPSSEAGHVTVRVEGRLEAIDASELADKFGPSASVLTFDLSGLLSADEAALDMLVELRAAGADLVGASAYVRYLLELASAPGLNGPIASQN